MRRKLIVTACLSAFLMSVQAQSGGISQEMLREIQRSQQPVNRAIANAIAANSIDALAKNHQNARAFDTYFSIETPKQSITDQKSSGRCWMFSGLNVLRSNLAQRDSVNMEFSQAYLFFWDQLEKANLMLQGVIDTAKEPIDHQRVRFFFQNPINDGGTFCGVSDLVDKYGLVPSESSSSPATASNCSSCSCAPASSP